MLWRLNKLNYKATGKKPKKKLPIEVDNEINYLLELYKFRGTKAKKIRRNTFKGIDPEIMDSAIIMEKADVKDM